MSSRRRTSLASSAAIATVGAATTWVATLSWRGFTEDSQRFLVPLLLLGVIVVGTGLLLRWWRVAGPLVVLAQVMVSLAVTSTILVGTPLPLGDAGSRLVAVFSDAVTTSERFAPPVPAGAPGIHPLLIAGGLACLLLVDALACTMRRVPLAGLPLLTIYSVPVSMLGEGLSWWIFSLTALGFLAMLFLHESEVVARWGRPLGAQGDLSVAGRSGAVRTSAGTIGGVATALALVVPIGVPTLGLQLFDIGPGSGGDSDIRITNPMVDLQRDLTRGRDIPLVRLTTDDPDPSYLRISVLNRFVNTEWSSGDRDVPGENRADGGPLPSLAGVAAAVPRQEYSYDVQVGPSFQSTWLPTMSQISSVDAPGDWRYDATTMDFLAADDDLDTAGLDYSMTGVELDLDPVDLADAPPALGLVSSDFTDLPSGIDSMVRNLALDVTRDAPTRFEKAVALQNWFREDGGFTYDDSVNLGNGTNDLVRFLSNGEGGRTGYCEQFASSMAVMARMLGIPARVAVGFLNPDRLEGDTWEYSAHDLHAWPELFISGAGWVRFEPTPAGRATDVPDYTQADIPAAPETSSPSASASAAPQPSQAQRPTADPADAAAAEDGSQGGSGFPWGPTLGGGAGVLLAGLVLLLPRLVRRTRRERHFAGGPEDAWAELRDTVVDLRLPWPEDRSPRETRAVLVGWFGAPVDDFTPDRPRRGPEVAPDAVHALDRIVDTLERLRYSRTAPPGGSLRAEVQTCVDSLAGGVTARTRRRATWWPRSVFQRTTPPVPGSPGAPVPVGSGVDSVG